MTQQLPPEYYRLRDHLIYLETRRDMAPANKQYVWQGRVDACLDKMNAAIDKVA